MKQNEPRFLGMRREMRRRGDWPYPHHPNGAFDPVLGEPKAEKHIYLRRDQLFYDIEAQVGIVSSSRRKDDGSEDDKLSNSVERYKGMIDRWIGRYIGLAKGRMSAIVLDPHKRSDTNVVPTSEEEDIELSVPFWWDETTFEQLSDSVHDYVVQSVLFEFFALTLTTKDPVTVDKKELADKAYGDIKRFACAYKPGTVRKKIQPF